MQERQHTAQANRVVKLRDTKQQSWATIAEAEGVSPATARRLYDSVMGAGAHVGLLPGKGGRLPASFTKPARRRSAVKTTATAAKARKATSKSTRRAA